MKFKAIMYESLSMKNLAFITSTITKLSKSCVLRLTRSEMSFLICEENSSPKQVIVWCLIDARQFYNEYIVESMPPVHEIFLECPTDMLSTSLNNLKGGNSTARSVKIKLTCKISPCLTIEIDLLSDVGVTRTCVHDIPVKVLPKALWNEFNEPPSHSYNAVIELRSLKKVRSVVERLKKLCTHVVMKPSSEGTLCISASAHSVTLNSFFKNVILVESSGDLKCSVRVDTKKLCLLLCCESLNTKKTLCSFMSNELVHMHLFCDLFQVHFYLTTVDE